MTTALPEAAVDLAPHRPDLPLPTESPETDVPELAVLGGLAGFPDSERYALVELPEAPPLFLLKSLQQPGLEFVVAPPTIFFPDYAPTIDDVNAARLGLTSADDALLLVVLTIGGDVASTTANLLAPIVIHEKTRRAAQVVLSGDWSLRAPLQA